MAWKIKKSKNLQKKVAYGIIKNVKTKPKVVKDGIINCNIYIGIFNICIGSLCGDANKIIRNKGKRFLGFYRGKSNVGKVR